MFTNARARRSVAAASAAALLGLLAQSGVAQAMPSDHPNYEQHCTPKQVDVGLSPLHQSMHHENGQVTFTAKPGASCLLAGSPVLTFLGGDGEALHINTDYPQHSSEPIRVDDAHPAAASLRYQVIDPQTGDTLPGPTPTAVDVAFPPPWGAYTLTLPWTSGLPVPKPVNVTNVSFAAPR